MKQSNKVDYQRTLKRTEQKEAGLFDGRFKAKVIPNKKYFYHLAFLSCSGSSLTVAAISE